MCNPAMKRGVLIVFDGIDGTGKTTQAKRLLETLKKNGFNAVYFREPSDSQWGREIKQKAALAGSLSAEEELELFQKDRKENVAKNLKPALEQNKIVVLDRYYYSTIAYQGARGIDPLMIRKMNEEFAVKPDLVFILDITPREGLRRIEKNRKEKDLLFEQEDYLEKVRKIFRSFKDRNIFHIDAFRSEEDIYMEIDNIVCDFLKDLRQS
jgi:dTMP kinase